MAALSGLLAALARPVAAAILLFALAYGEPARADQTLLLEVIVNGYPTGKIGEFVQRDGELLARPSELRELGFRVSRRAPSHESDLVPLSSLPGLNFRFDGPTQTLYVTGGEEGLLPQLLQVAGAQGSNLAVESGTGATLNYDVIGTALANQNGGSGLFDMRLFSPWGVASSGLLAFAGANLRARRRPARFGSIRPMSIPTRSVCGATGWATISMAVSAGRGRSASAARKSNPTSRCVPT